MKTLLHLLIVYMLNLWFLITKSTSFSYTSPTLIDNILTNKCSNSASSGLLIADISEHLPMFYISKSEDKQILYSLLLHH